MTSEVRFPSYRAPQKDREILCVPPWAAIRQEFVGQREAFNTFDVEILGVSLAELARDARCAMLAEAMTYTQSYTKVTESPCADAPLIITGHQPELIHPGVWLKNFAAGQLAQAVGGTAINLVIDNDLCRSPALRVPTGTVEQPRAVDIPFDTLQQEVPYEQRTIAEREVWNSFGDRVTEAIAPFVSEPLIAQWWPEVVKISKSTTNLGLAIAQARHSLQQSWGSHSLEIPQSQICRTAPFHRFALHLLSNAERLRHDYNGALAEYRQVHHLRSAAQPLPDLSEADEWIETPFWIWTQDNPTRRALFVRGGAEGLQLSDRQHWQETLPLKTETALQRLSELQHAGVKIRTRALITTLYARLLLADTFIHGIGGAKYDQVTDAFCLRFFGVAPPSFVTLSGTLRLPIDHVGVSPTCLSELRQALRGIRYHPECFVRELGLDSAGQSQVEQWVEQKKHWVQTAKTKSNAGERHAQIRAANDALQAWLQPQRQQLEQMLAATVAQTRTNTLLESREYPFCLFPREVLRNFLLDFSRSMP